MEKSYQLSDISRKAWCLLLLVREQYKVLQLTGLLLNTISEEASTFRRIGLVFIGAKDWFVELNPWKDPPRKWADSLRTLTII
jgi:hypothetical protein